MACMQGVLCSIHYELYKGYHPLSTGHYDFSIGHSEFCAGHKELCRVHYELLQGMSSLQGTISSMQVTMCCYMKHYVLKQAGHRALTCVLEYLYSALCSLPRLIITF